MRGFSDIHTHILPGVDDGAVDLEEALQMVRMAWQNGTRVLFLTPHYFGHYLKGTKQDIQDAYSAFCRQVSAEFPDMKLYLGTELSFEVEAAEKLANGEILTLNHSRYVLLEFAYSILRFQLVSGVSELIRWGYTPIIAHAERCGNFYQFPELMDELLEMGALVQLNADSVMGRNGFFVKRFCHKLLKAQKVHFIASDAHNTQNRQPVLQSCYERVCKKYGREYARKLFADNIQAVIENRPLQGESYGSTK